MRWPCPHPLSEWRPTALATWAARKSNKRREGCGPTPARLALGHAVIQFSSQPSYLHHGDNVVGGHENLEVKVGHGLQKRALVQTLGNVAQRLRLPKRVSILNGKRLAPEPGKRWLCVGDLARERVEWRGTMAMSRAGRGRGTRGWHCASPCSPPAAARTLAPAGMSTMRYSMGKVGLALCFIWLPYLSFSTKKMSGTYSSSDEGLTAISLSESDGRRISSGSACRVGAGRGKGEEVVRGVKRT